MLHKIPFQTIDWTSIEKETYPGETGSANWQSIQFGGIRVRLVEYSKDYCADHWCQKGHIVHCLEGEFITNSRVVKKFDYQKVKHISFPMIVVLIVHALPLALNYSLLMAIF